MFLRPDQIPVDGTSIQVVNGQLVSASSTPDLINRPDSTSYYYFNDFVEVGSNLSSLDNEYSLPPLNWFTNTSFGTGTYDFGEALGILQLVGSGGANWKRDLIYGIRSYISGPAHKFPVDTHNLISISTRVWSAATVNANLNYYFGFHSVSGSISDITATTALRGNTSRSFIGFVKSSSTSTLLCRTQSGANATEVDTGIIYTASQFYRLKITVNADFSIVNFYVNDGLVASISTDIPQDPLTPFYRLENPTGNSEAGAWGIDWVEIKVDGGVNRGAADANPITYTVSGVVTSSEGNGPIEGAVVSVPSLNILDTTNASGEYTLILPAGLHTIEASADEHINYSAPTALQVNQNIVDNDFEMTASATVSGTVTSSVTGNTVVGGVSVVIDSSSPANTDSVGVYTKTGLPRVGTVSRTSSEHAYYNASSGFVDLNSADVTHNFSVSPKTMIASGYPAWTSHPYQHLGQGFRPAAGKKLYLTGASVRIGNSGGSSVTKFLRLYGPSGSLLREISSTHSPAVDFVTYYISFASPILLDPLESGYYMLTMRRTNPAEPGSLVIGTTGSLSAVGVVYPSVGHYSNSDSMPDTAAAVNFHILPIYQL